MRTNLRIFVDCECVFCYWIITNGTASDLTRLLLNKSCVIVLRLNYSLIMAEDRVLINKLVKTKENIKHKYNAIKRGEANVHLLMTQMFKHIKKPLSNISDNNLYKSL